MYIFLGMLETELIPAVSDKEEVVVKAVFDPSKKSFSMAEVAEHVDRESAWFVVNDKVYDGTPFLQAHPGGAESILIR
jgi:nitrate reductase (NAD(P)H)